MGPFANDGVRGIDGSGREVTLVMQFFGGFLHFLYLDSAYDSVIYIGPPIFQPLQVQEFHGRQWYFCNRFRPDLW